MKGAVRMKKLLGLQQFRRAIRKAKQRRFEIWKDEMEELDRSAFGYYLGKEQ